MPATVAQTKADIIQRFPRTDSIEVTQQVDAHFETWVRALCRIHPWQFMTVRPGSLAGVFPIEDVDDLFPAYPDSGEWFHRGWLATTVGQDTYEFKAPFDDTLPDLGFHDAQVRNVVSVKAYSLEGTFKGEVPCHTSSLSMSRSDFSSEATGPCFVWVETFPEISVLRLHPTPMERFILSVEFVLAAAPNYTVEGDQFNRFVSAAPDAVQEYGLMHLAKFFDESGLYQLYREALYGNPPNGLHTPATQHGGILVDMREAERTQGISQDTRLEHYSGALQPYTARGGSRRRKALYGVYFNS